VRSVGIPLHATVRSPGTSATGFVAPRRSILPVDARLFVHFRFRRACGFVTHETCTPPECAATKRPDACTRCRFPLMQTFQFESENMYFEVCSPGAFGFKGPLAVQLAHSICEHSDCFLCPPTHLCLTLRAHRRRTFGSCKS
jgi:hypothetical protein